MIVIAMNRAFGASSISTVDHLLTIISALEKKMRKMMACIAMSETAGNSGWRRW